MSRLWLSESAANVVVEVSFFVLVFVFVTKDPFYIFINKVRTIDPLINIKSINESIVCVYLFSSLPLPILVILAESECPR